MIDRRRALLTQKKGGRLPSGYQEVEWIESHGNEFVNTELGLDLSQEWVVKAQISSDNGYWWNLFDYYGEQIKFDVRYVRISWVRFGSTSEYQYPPNNSSSPLVGFNTSPRIIRISNGALIIQKELTADEYVYNWTPATTISQNDKVKIPKQGAQYKIFEVVVNQMQIKKLQLIPCYRKSDGVIGMYDLCGSICTLTGTPFYINAGTGTFTTGADVN